MICNLYLRPEYLRSKFDKGHSYLKQHNKYTWELPQGKAIKARDELMQQMNWTPEPIDR